jgi:hypothetical protein
MALKPLPQSHPTDPNEAELLSRSHYMWDHHFREPGFFPDPKLTDFDRIPQHLNLKIVSLPKLGLLPSRSWKKRDVGNKFLHGRLII